MSTSSGTVPRRLPDTFSLFRSLPFTVTPNSINRKMTFGTPPFPLTYPLPLHAVGLGWKQSNREQSAWQGSQQRFTASGVNIQQLHHVQSAAATAGPAANQYIVLDVAAADDRTVRDALGGGGRVRSRVGGARINTGRRESYGVELKEMNSAIRMPGVGQWTPVHVDRARGGSVHGRGSRKSSDRDRATKKEGTNERRNDLGFR